MREGIHESRTGFEDRVGAGGTALFGSGLPFGYIYATRACIVYDAKPLRHARSFLASGNPKPVGESQPDRLHSMVQLRYMISRGELIGVAVLVVIGAVLIALAPAKQLTEPVSRRSSYQPH
jgi:hypothetical protein